MPDLEPGSYFSEASERAFRENRLIMVLLFVLLIALCRLDDMDTAKRSSERYGIFADASDRGATLGLRSSAALRSRAELGGVRLRTTRDTLCLGVSFAILETLKIRTAVMGAIWSSTPFI
jgi:hypothetical protein